MAVELVVGTGIETGKVMGVTGVGCCHLFSRDRTADNDGRGRSAVEGDSDRSNGRGLVSFSEVNRPVRGSPDVTTDRRAADPSKYSGGGCFKG